MTTFTTKAAAKCSRSRLGRYCRLVRRNPHIHPRPERKDPHVSSPHRHRRVGLIHNSNGFGHGRNSDEILLGRTAAGYMPILRNQTQEANIDSASSNLSSCAPQSTGLPPSTTRSPRTRAEMRAATSSRVNACDRLLSCTNISG